MNEALHLRIEEQKQTGIDPRVVNLLEGYHQSTYPSVAAAGIPVEGGTPILMAPVVQPEAEWVDIGGFYMPPGNYNFPTIFPVVEGLKPPSGPFTPGMRPDLLDIRIRHSYEAEVNTALRAMGLDPAIVRPGGMTQRYADLHDLELPEMTAPPATKPRPATLADVTGSKAKVQAAREAYQQANREHKEEVVELKGAPSNFDEAVNTLASSFDAQDIFYIVEGRPTTIDQIIAMKVSDLNKYKQMLKEGKVLRLSNPSDREKFNAALTDLGITIKSIAQVSGMPPMATYDPPTVKVIRSEASEIIAYVNAHCPDIRIMPTVAIPGLRTLAVALMDLPLRCKWLMRPKIILLILTPLCLS